MGLERKREEGVREKAGTYYPSTQETQTLGDSLKTRLRAVVNHYPLPHTK